MEFVWTAFMKNGDPNTDSLPCWKAYSPENAEPYQFL